MIKINLNTILLIIVTIISFILIISIFFFHIKYERYKFPKNLSNLAKKFANDFNQLIEKKDINVKNLRGHAFRHIEGKLLDFKSRVEQYRNEISSKVILLVNDIKAHEIAVGVNKENRFRRVPPTIIRSLFNQWNKGYYTTKKLYRHKIL